MCTLPPHNRVDTTGMTYDFYYNNYKIYKQRFIYYIIVGFASLFLYFVAFFSKLYILQSRI